MEKNEEIKDPVATAAAGNKISTKRLPGGANRREVVQTINGHEYRVIVEDGTEKR